jgi:hypothetical protein
LRQSLPGASCQGQAKATQRIQKQPKATKDNGGQRTTQQAEVQGKHAHKASTLRREGNSKNSPSVYFGEQLFGCEQIRKTQDELQWNVAQGILSAKDHTAGIGCAQSKHPSKRRQQQKLPQCLFWWKMIWM